MVASTLGLAGTVKPVYNAGSCRYVKPVLNAGSCRYSQTSVEHWQVYVQSNL